MNLIPWLSQRSVSTSAKTRLQRTENSSLSSRKSLHVEIYDLLDSSTGLESPKFSLQRAKALYDGQIKITAPPAENTRLYICAFYGLSVGENKPHLGSYRNGWQAGPM